jgi:hypothetical protein
MKIDSSNKRYSTIFAGILVILVLSILLAFLIGCGDRNIYNQDKIQATSKGAHFSPDCYRSGKDAGKNKNVPVAQNFDWLGVDTVRGTMDWSVYLDGVDITIDSMDMPLCIIDDPTSNLLDSTKWYVTVTVTGGYEPKLNYFNYIEFYQKDMGWQTIEIYWDLVPVVSSGPCGCTKTYTGRMSVFIDEILNVDTDGDQIPDDTDGLDDGPGIIKFDSNKLPICASNIPSSGDLGKLIDIYLWTHWKGCNGPDQQFEKILIHKKFYFRSPQLPIN